jgi:hypothetical protein
MKIIENKKENLKLINEFVNKKDYIFFSCTDQTGPNISNFPYIAGFNKDEFTINNPELINFFSINKHSPSIFKNGKRNNDSWFCASAIPFDCDGEETLENAKNILNNLKCSYLIVTSKSHQKEKKGIITDRFHFFIIPNKPIISRERYQQYIKYFTEKLKCDKACKDFARYFAETPDLKQIEAIVFNKEFDNNFKEETFTESKTTIKNHNPIKEILNDAQLQFVEQVSNMHPELIYSHYNPSNGTMNFYRNSKDPNPGLFIYPDKKVITDPSNDTLKSVVFSMKDFNEAEPIRKDFIEFLKKKIKNDILSYNSKEYRVDVIKTNEGTGKSYAACQLLEPGNFFTTNTIKLIYEVEKTLCMLKKRYVIIHSNTNLIYNIITMNRGETEQSIKEAEAIQTRYEKFFAEKLPKKIKTKNEEEQNNFVIEATINGSKDKNVHDKILTFIKTELEKIAQDDDENSVKECMSIGKFLQQEYNNENIYEDEVDMILDEYKNQINLLKAQNTIYLMTTHKFYCMIKLIKTFSQRVICFQDECNLDLYKKTKIIEENNPLYSYLRNIAFVKSRSPLQGYETYFNSIIENEIDNEKKDILKNIKDNKNEYYLAMSYGTCTSLITQQEIDWYKQDNFHFIILTTEDLPLAILPESDNIKHYDYSHKIYSPKLKFIGIDGLNSFKNSDYIFQGKDRLLFVKRLIMDRLKIDEDMIISNSLQQKWNFVNSKGTNTFKDSIQKINDTKDLAIIVTYPHPKEINEKKGFYLNDCIEMAKKANVIAYDYLNSKEFENFIISRIMNDNLNQALGRVCGYRDTNKISNVYVFMNSSLLSFVETNYITTQIFTYTGFYQSKQKRNENPIVWEFLQKTQLLHARGNKLEFTCNTIIALKNEKVLTPSWIKYIIGKVYNLSIELEKKKKFKKIFHQTIHTLKHNFDSIKSYVRQYILINNSTTLKNIRYLVGLHGWLKLLKNIKGDLTIFYKSETKFLYIR